MPTIKVEIPQSQVDEAIKKEMLSLKKELGKSQKLVEDLSKELNTIKSNDVVMEQVKDLVERLADLLDVRCWE